MSNYGLIIKKEGVSKNVENCIPKELAFSSSYACAKILQPGRYVFTIADSTDTIYTLPFDALIAFPILILAFLFDPSDSSYKALGSEDVQTGNFRGKFWFDTDNLYIQVSNYTGASIDSHLIYFICYA